MSNHTSLESRVRAADDRAGLLRLLAELGLGPIGEEIPRGAWSTYGLGQAPDVESLVVAARAGSLDALLFETTPGTGPDRVAWLAGRVRARNPARLHLFVAASPDYRRMVLGTFGLGDAFRHITLERERVRASDLEALAEMAPANGEVGLELALRQARALDRSRVTRSFFRDFRGQRGAVAEAWTGLPADAHRERAQLALLFLSRLTFLYFLQRRGALAGDDRYLASLLGRWHGRDRGSGPAGGWGRTARPIDSAPPTSPSAFAGPALSPGPGPSRSFFRARLQPLFFGALNRRPEDRTGAARQLGELPYLNGGLFEPHGLERAYPDLDLPDATVRSCLDDLLERYRFTTREEGDHPGFGVDPEVLGRVFEGLMSPEVRSETGSFYTPAPVVQRVVREAVGAYVAGTVADADLDAVVEGRGRTLPDGARYRIRRKLQRVRVLDPACGSGAFLLGALQRLARVLGGLDGRLEGDVRQELAPRSLHGVDLLDDAALLCSLRLWLALSGEPGDEIRPLPNLDRRIRQGDALIDPLDLATASDLEPGSGLPWHPLRDPGTRRALRSVEPAVRAYVASGPRDREQARGQVRQAETRLARQWIQGLRRATGARLLDLQARADDRDLFGEPTESARRARQAAGRMQARIEELDRTARRLEEDGALPFFSFGVHFAHAGDGFDFVISNPPWVRSHHWPDRIRAVADRFEVCRAPGWQAAAQLTGAPAAGGAQVDLSLLFVERSIRLLAPGGVLAVLLPAKSFRALYAGAARRMLLRDLDITLIEDHALDQRAIFRADAFAGVLVGRRDGRRAAAESGVLRDGETGAGHEGAAQRPVRVRMTRPGADTLSFRLVQADLPLFPGDPASPWLLAPPEVRRVLRRMQAAGPPLGRHEGLRVRRGVMTGANDVLVFSSVDPKLGGLAHVEAAGFGRARRSGGSAQEADPYRATVETAAVRPLVRGMDVDAFRYEVSSHVVWCHDRSGNPVSPGPRMTQYLERHQGRLERRSGYRMGLPLGVIFRLAPETLGPKVAWHDLSDTLRAVALPAAVRFDGADRELVPLNTVYFLPTPDHETALAAAGLLNSLPLRTFARVVAERAKDARFRFFAWTVSSLPLPANWLRHPATAEILALSMEAHGREGISPARQARLDRAVAALYGLDSAALETLAGFDAWLRGTR